MKQTDIILRSETSPTAEDLCCYLLEAFLLCPSHSCLRWKSPSSCEEEVESWFLGGSVDDWLVLLFLPEVGEALGLGSLELRSATPFTSSPLSMPSWTVYEEMFIKIKERLTTRD